VTLRPETLVVSAGRPHLPGAAVNPPLVLTSTYRSAGDLNAYARSEGNETLGAFEAAAGALDGGTALAFASGIAAVAAIAEGRPAGTVAVVPKSAYSGSLAIFDDQQRLGRMHLRSVDMTDTDAVRAALEGADLLWVETISNPLMGVPDLPVLLHAARAAGALTCVDATFSTPFGVRPLEHGADVVMHSTTKYFAGHSDLLGGLLITRSAELVDELRTRRTHTGAIPSAFDSYLTLRGMRTLALRMERAQANAMELAQRLAAHPRVTRVRYPGLPGDPGHQRATSVYDGFGAMLSFEVDGGVDAAERVCSSVRLITHATSLGGVESLIERRARYEGDATTGTPESLLRFSVGIEHVEDLWADLEQALSG
jgi:cystathionine gamma-synthase